MTRPSLLLRFACLLLLSSCSSPPKPPTVDESTRRPVNSAMAVDLQTCRSQLENTRIVAADSARSAEASAQAMARIAHQQQVLTRSIEASAAAQRNRLFTVLFAFGSAGVALPDADAARILDEARAAPLIVLRGRTDGAIESRTESAIARRRADAVQAWLVHSGVDRARIRTTWQPVGDHAADNEAPGGRTLNRRVEIEIYRAVPIVAAAGASAQPAAPQ